MTEATTPEPLLNRAGRRAESRRLRKAGAVMAAIPATFGTTALALAATTGSVGAATTWVVNDNADTGDGTCDPSPGDCTLRDALDDAADGDTITFDTSIFNAGALAADKTILLDSQLEVTTGVTITGPGADAAIIDGQGTTRLFYLDTDTGGQHFTISGLTLTGAYSASGIDNQGFGGVVYVDEDDDLTIADSLVTGNEVTHYGGVIFTQDPAVDLELTNSVFSDNTANAGGGVVATVYFRNLTVTDATFSGNQANLDIGGALYLAGGQGDVIITGSSFVGNTAAAGGGAIYIDEYGWGGGTSVTITATEFRDNAAGADGGAIAAKAPLATFAVRDATFTGNVAGNRGGGVFVTNADQVTIESTTLTGNTSEGKGGGLNVGQVDGDVSITDTVVSDNTVTDNGAGGAKIFSVGGAVTITGTTVTGNSAYNYGGGLYINGITGATTISTSTIADNTAELGAGGGLELFDIDDSLVIESTTVSGNSSGNRGGGMYITGIAGGTKIYNSTISGNHAGNQGGGIAFTDYYGLTVVQSTITQNSATTFGGIYLPEAGGQSVTASGSEHGARATERTGTAATKGDAGTVTLSGTIVTGNTGTDIGAHGTATASSSLLGSLSGTTLVDGGGNLQGVSPLLGPLQDNGGPTQTHALLDGSPAINAGPDPLTPFPGSDDDQRGPGYPRVVGGRVDIGAFEVQPTDIEPTFTG